MSAYGCSTTKRSTTHASLAQLPVELQLLIVESLTVNHGIATHHDVFSLSRSCQQLLRTCHQARAELRRSVIQLSSPRSARAFYERAFEAAAKANSDPGSGLASDSCTSTSTATATPTAAATAAATATSSDFPSDPQLAIQDSLNKHANFDFELVHSIVVEGEDTLREVGETWFKTWWGSRPFPNRDLRYMLTSLRHIEYDVDVSKVSEDCTSTCTSSLSQFETDPPCGLSLADDNHLPQDHSCSQPSGLTSPNQSLRLLEECAERWIGMATRVGLNNALTPRYTPTLVDFAYEDLEKVDTGQAAMRDFVVSGRHSPDKTILHYTQKSSEPTRVWEQGGWQLRYTRSFVRRERCLDLQSDLHPGSHRELGMDTTLESGLAGEREAAGSQTPRGEGPTWRSSQRDLENWLVDSIDDSTSAQQMPYLFVGARVKGLPLREAEHLQDLITSSFTEGPPVRSSIEPDLSQPELSTFATTITMVS